MGYDDVNDAIDRAWDQFYNSLCFSGFTTKEIVKFDSVLDSKDGFSKVREAAMEAVR